MEGWPTRLNILAALVAASLAGCAPAPAPRDFDAVAQAQAVVRVFNYLLMGLSSEPSDAALHDAVVTFWKQANARVTETTKIACYPFPGDYAGSGRPTLCRYSVVFDDFEDGRATVEAGFDNDHSDHWYLTTSFGSAVTCIGCTTGQGNIRRQ